jgi:hypothetical protein
MMASDGKKPGWYKRLKNKATEVKNNLAEGVKRIGK